MKQTSKTIISILLTLLIALSFVTSGFSVDALATNDEPENYGDTAIVDTNDIDQPDDGSLLSVSEDGLWEYTTDWVEGEFGAVITDFFGGDANIVIPEKINGDAVIALADGVFFGEKVTSITFPKYFCSFGNFDPADYPLLTALFVDEDNELFTSIDGVIYTKNGGQLLFGSAKKADENGVSDVPDDKQILTAISNLEVIPAAATMNVGGSSLLLQVIPNDGILTYKSSNVKVATVDADGRVTAVGKGIAKITVTDTVRKKSAIATITVNQSVSITLPQVVYVVKGKSVILKPTISPAGLKPAPVLIWSVTAGGGVVAVDPKGKVTASGINGDAVVQVEIKDQAVSAQISVHVVDAATAVTIDQGKKVEVNVGQPLQLTTTVEPGSCDDKPVFISNKPAIAAVDYETGLVTAYAKGSAVITATTGSGKKAAITVTVNQPATAVALPAKIYVVAGSSVALKPVYTPSNSNDKVTWSVNDPSEIINGAIGANGSFKIKPGVTSGTATITATTTLDSGNAKTADVQVIAVTPATSVVFTDAKGINLNPGDTYTLHAEVAPVGCDDTPVFTSSKPSIASVDYETGEVTAHAKGKAVITATTGSGKKATYTINVNLPAELIIFNPNTIEGDVWVVLGKTTPVSVILGPVGSNDKMNWTITPGTGDISFTKQSALSCTIKGEALGTVTLRATATLLGASSIYKDITVHVVVGATAVSIDEGKAGIVGIGHTLQLNATVTPDDGVYTDVPQWKSSNEKIAKVDNKTGLVTGMAKGKAVITALAASGKKATYTVTVVDNSWWEGREPLVLEKVVTADINTKYGNRWYEFVPSVTGTYYLKASNLTSVKLQPVALCFTEDWAFVGFGYGEIPGIGFCASLDLDAGESYQIAAYSDNAATGKFDLVLSTNDIFEIKIPATPIVALDTPVSVNISKAGANACLSFTPDTSGWYAAISSNRSNSKIDPWAELLDSRGQYLCYDDDSAGDLNFCLVWYFNAGETYYISAGSFENATGKFNVTITELPDDNLHRGSPAEIMEKTPVRVDIGPPTGQRWYSFTPTISGTYTMSSYAQDNDPKMTLYNSSFISMAEADDTYMGWYWDTNFELTIDLEAGETYYICCGSWASPDSYYLFIERILLTPNHFDWSNLASGSLTLSWDGVSWATEYEVYQNGILKATTATTAYNVAGLSAGNTYSFDVVATDGLIKSNEATLNVATPPSSFTALGLGVTTPVNIDIPSRWRWYSFTPTETAVYVIKSSSPGSTDPAAVLFEYSGGIYTPLVKADNSGADYDENFILQENLTAGKTYYIAAYSRYDSGTYYITASKLNAAVMLSTPLIGQDMDCWCWCASAKMLAATYYPVTRTQTEAVTYLWGYPWNDGGYPQESADAARYFSDNTMNFTAKYSTETEANLTKLLTEGNALILNRGWYWEGYRYGGHATVVYGYYTSGSTKVYLIRDPWPADNLPAPGKPGITRHMTYAEIKNGASDGYDTGKWDNYVRKAA